MAKKRTKRIALALIRDENDRLMMGMRNDNKKWTTPGGSIEVGECPFAGVARELKEETGLDAKDIKLVRAGMEGGLLLYLFEVSIDEGQKVDCSKDPDKECDNFSFQDPYDHTDNLHVSIDKNWVIEYWANN